MMKNVHPNPDEEGGKDIVGAMNHQIRISWVET